MRLIPVEINAWILFLYSQTPITFSKTLAGHETKISMPYSTTMSICHQTHLKKQTDDSGTDNDRFLGNRSLTDQHNVDIEAQQGDTSNSI
jgi:hypothetical protein